MKTTLFTLAAAGVVYAQTQTSYGQCGGNTWLGPSACPTGQYCSGGNDYYSGCVPGTAPPTSTRPKPTATRAPASGKRVKYAGVNIAGFDFGCDTTGTCGASSAFPPGSKGVGQMNHFVTDDGLNAFRLPVSWQYLVNGVLGGSINANNLAIYDKLVQACIASGAALCEIDIHNYARWNGKIIGQDSGAPTNAQFASFWGSLAAKYANNNKVAFGIMNEPHDLDINLWATTVQAAVTAIRQAGATTNYVLIPGTNYASAGQFLDNGSGAALLPVHNPDGTFTNIIFDVHKYLDSDNSGTHPQCTTNNSAVFTTLGNWLRTNKRSAFLTETGGGPTDTTCYTNLCQQFETMNSYNDVYFGWIGWAAGQFDPSYVLSEVPTQNSDGSWADVPLVTKCVAGEFNGDSS
ncbi:hypothetical protein LTR78_000098 [Recurvomyces mirabilis]|uniref:Endoglucanase EG-II n=1 Tax=Recurvomyces mirabilis TaxID=574656 RepID=A0AAE0WWL2_9PEZI|nr:hypothetical protein LTR78_000098 [Recurvomyces mirabilis]KAK5161755.1 hypothetical protein LTS14_000100 [Recurvomyces mirabilis]